MNELVNSIRSINIFVNYECDWLWRGCIEFLVWNMVGFGRKLEKENIKTGFH